ncbi:AbrB family transcriptional regulator [Bradyrhizobium erythrophlei]|uniref:Ammonia monooxygenase n=1 Tax=Bradyrhizobium erythrophlei TaxID=1437360 RepID=A0A1H4R9Q4_9BRAD|nr:AbrB family transcriptional regulator [Bradyrhizobium erythrophlei]SEC28605.1 hypothetical protein SAMN05444164_1469 [Bradyrhizobium erythrophlei]
MNSIQPQDGALGRLEPATRWAVLVLASLVLGGLLEQMRLPAALLLGPLVAAVLMQTAGAPVRVPRIAMLAAQAVIGCLVARAMTPAILAGFSHHWLLFVSVILLSVSASALIGWAISFFRIIPGSTAVWGMLPGGATVMMVMAEAHGADFRLVAFMQYLRVVMVAAAASVVAVMFVHGGGSPVAAGLLSPVDWKDFAATVVVAVVGGWLGLAMRIPAGVLLGPLAIGATLVIQGWIRIELPPLVLIASYALIGWSTGLGFTREILATAMRALPQCLGAILLLMATCGALAWFLVIALHIDPLTAYLATSPGGVDAAAIIAAGTKVDMSFVMALQVLRIVVLLVIGPRVARWVTGTLDTKQRTADEPTSSPPQ